MRKQLSVAALACLAGAHFAPAAAQAQADGQFSLGVGFNYSTGTYGTSTSTDIVSIPFTARYDKGPWTFKATVPYLSISGASSVIPGVGAIASSNPTGRGRSGSAGTTPANTTTTGTASGIGDTVLAATYNVLYDNASKFGVDLTGKMKLATADANKGLGTGENDYGVQADTYKTFDRTTVFGGVGYTALGSSSFLQLRNVWNLNLGALYKVDEQNSFGASYDYRQKVSDSAAPISELTGFWTRKIDRSWKAQAYVLKGLANGSPDWGVGGSVAYAF